jgi:hypothetical protein
MDAYKTILRLTDDAIPSILAMQQADPTKRDYKGQITPEKGFAEPNHSGSVAGTLLAAYFCEDSRWYGDKVLLDAAVNALEFLNEMCHEDGSIDLLETNPHDCTSNGFAVQQVAYTYRLLVREAKSKKEVRAKELAKDFLRKSAKAMLTGGFHTPNHRWVVASALSLCYRCLGDERCLDWAKVYLSEGVDCNEEGDYTERSVGIYDVVNNESLTILAQELNMPNLYESVDRNLDKNWYYMEPDLTGLTLASRRQDYGREVQMTRHFYTYYQAALRTGSRKFAWIANRILEQMEKLRVTIGTPNEIASSLHHQNLLQRFMLSERQPLPMEDAMPLVYNRYFERAGIVRYRQDNWTCSLVRDNSTFMKIQNGNLRMYVKLACTFFAHGRLIADELKPIEGGYRLSCEKEWGYVRPLPNVNEPDWHKIDHTARPHANIQKLRWEVDVFFREKGVTLHIRSEGTPRIPMKLECILPAGGLLRSSDLTVPTTEGGWAIAGETVEYNLGGEGVRMEGGFNEHVYTFNMRNSDPQPMNRFCLYCTGFTPVERIVKFDII